MSTGRYELKGYTAHSVGLGESYTDKEELRRKGLSGLAITDVNSVSGWMVCAECADDDFAFLYGVDVTLQDRAYTIDDILGYAEDDGCDAVRATILVKNEIGKKNLMELLFAASAWGKDMSAYPIVEADNLKKHREGILVGYSCDNNILTAEEPDFEKELKESSLTRMIGLFDYVEVAPADYNPLFPYVDLRKREYVQEYTKRLIEYSENHEKPVVAVSGFCYLNKEDGLCWRVLQCEEEISACEGHHISEYGMEAHLRTTEEMLKEFQYLGDDEARKIVIDNTVKIAKEIETFEPKTVPDCHIHWDDAEEQLRQRICRALSKKYERKMIDDAKKRAEEEMVWIIENGYTELLLMFADAVAKHGIHWWDHSAYGELENSVVAYVLGITSVDPITNRLPFEFLINAANYEDFYFGISVPHSKRKKYISSLGKMRGVSSNVSGTMPMHYRNKEVRGMLDVYERISGKKMDSESREKIEGDLTGLTSPLRYSDVPYYLLPKGMEITIDRRWNGDGELVSDFLEWPTIYKKFSSYTIASGEEEDILLTLEQLTGKTVGSIDLRDKSPMAAFEYDSDTEAPKWSAGIYSEKNNDTVLSFGIESFEDMVLIEGLDRGKGTWDKIQKELLERGDIRKDNLITNREDVYELLASKGIDIVDASRITNSICNGMGIKEQDACLMKFSGITDQELYILKHIFNLPMRADCIRMARIRFWFAYYKVNYPKQFYRTYLECIADSREWDVIMSGPKVVKDTLSLIRDYGDPTFHEQADWSDFEMSARAFVLADEMYRRHIRVKYREKSKKGRIKWLRSFSKRQGCMLLPALTRLVSRH